MGKLMRRHLQPIWYMLYKRTMPLLDENGYETGESRIEYFPAQRAVVNVSTAYGTTQEEMFGTLEGYDRVILTDDLTCPITENSVLFIEKAPEYDDTGRPLYDHIVKKVARSYNYIAYAVSKVKVS